MIIILLRTVILYMVVLIVIRIMGKSELSKMSPFQLVVIFMIAELAAIPIGSGTAPLIHGVIAIFTLLVLQVLISYMSIKSEKFKNLINGKPSILIENGKINEKELKNLRISLNDFLEQLRLCNAPSVADVDFAVMEANGDLSIIPKADKRPLTPSDIGIRKDEEIMPLTIISDGFLYSQNLKKVGFVEDQLKNCLRTLGIIDYKDVFFAFFDEEKKLHVYVTNQITHMASEVIA